MMITYTHSLQDPPNTNEKKLHELFDKDVWK
jgi:hypothetical protein